MDYRSPAAENHSRKGRTDRTTAVSLPGNYATRKTITLRNEAERLEPCIIEREEARQRLLIHNAPVGGLNRSRTTAHQISAS
jgi:hypothetical protein